MNRNQPLRSQPSVRPMLAKMLDDLIRLLMANLDEFVSEVAAFPLDDDWREAPAEVVAQGLVGKTPICFQPPRQPAGLSSVLLLPTIA